MLVLENCLDCCFIYFLHQLQLDQLQEETTSRKKNNDRVMIRLGCWIKVMKPEGEASPDTDELSKANQSTNQITD